VWVVAPEQLLDPDATLLAIRGGEVAGEELVVGKPFQPSLLLAARAITRPGAVPAPEPARSGTRA